MQAPDNDDGQVSMQRIQTFVVEDKRNGALLQGLVHSVPADRGEVGTGEEEHKGDQGEERGLGAKDIKMHEHEAT